MAYKFQLGLASMSGSLTQSGSLTIADDSSETRFTVDHDNGVFSGSNASMGSITAGQGGFVVSADGAATTTELASLDGGIDVNTAKFTVSSAGAIAVDTDKFTVSAAGAVTAASTVSGSGRISGKELIVDAVGVIGTVSDTDLLGLNTNLFTVNGTTLQKGALSGSGTLYAAGNISTSGDIAASGSLTSAGATISGTSALSVITATSLSASGGATFMGSSIFGSALNVSGNLQVDGTVVNMPNVGEAALDSADLIMSLDSTSKDVQLRTRANVVSDMAGTVTATGLAAASGVLSLDIDNLDAGVDVASGDTIVFNDDTDNGLHKVTFDDMMTKAMPLVAEDVFAPADDYVMFLDGSGTGDGKKEKWADLAELIAGAGITNTNGVLSADGSSTPTNVGDANGRLVEGFNYSSVAFTAARTWITPDGTGVSAGDKLIIKAPENADSFALTVSGGEGHKIDGVSEILMNSPSGSITLTYLGSQCWSIS